MRRARARPRHHRRRHITRLAVDGGAPRRSPLRHQHAVRALGEVAAPAAERARLHTVRAGLVVPDFPPPPAPPRRRRLDGDSGIARRSDPAGEAATLCDRGNPPAPVLVLDLLCGLAGDSVGVNVPGAFVNALVVAAIEAWHRRARADAVGSEGDFIRLAGLDDDARELVADPHELVVHDIQPRGDAVAARHDDAVEQVLVVDADPQRPQHDRQQLQHQPVLDLQVHHLRDHVPRAHVEVLGKVELLVQVPLVVDAVEHGGARRRLVQLPKLVPRHGLLHAVGVLHQVAAAVVRVQHAVAAQHLERVGHHARQHEADAAEAPRVAGRGAEGLLELARVVDVHVAVRVHHQPAAHRAVHGPVGRLHAHRRAQLVARE
mmetsp:Transcript_6507/g.23176  ORF Transcript_6507/g.23176 Transcript_6507/m.23176 type:complete len:376 (-) Transcript_6507:89-1216(-)